MESANHLRKISLAASSAKLLLICAGLLLTLSACAHPNRQPTSIAVTFAPPTSTIEPIITPEPAPGLVVHGMVQDGSGVGLENVQIYRSYAAYPGEVIATTDAHGQYASAFYPIPGDEMVSVWAEQAGVVFTPALCSWRHYYGFEQRQCDFEMVVP